ncbi:MAG TPA: superoxide dismutase [Terracidiphilus sp.]|jgi:Fe-Mn family superoxide dismutase
MAYELAPLPYDYAALEPFIDAETMHLHHDKHHQTYINNVNAALEKQANLASKPVDDLLRDLNAVPEDIRTAVRNNAGGHSNHTMFWNIMGPANTAGIGGAPSGPIADQIKADFGDFDAFKKLFNETTAKQFGSGWGWLVLQGGKLKVITTPNQDSPLSQGLYPILGNDVWEHAYYLKYQNRRPDYLAAWWNVVNWAEVNKRFGAAKG